MLSIIASFSCFFLTLFAIVCRLLYNPKRIYPEGEIVQVEDALEMSFDSQLSVEIAFENPELNEVIILNSSNEFEL